MLRIHEHGQRRLKEELSNSMVDFVMHAETRWQGRDRESATSGSERRDGQQAVMAKRVAQAPTLQASLDLQATITDATSRNRHVSAMVLLQVKDLRAL